MPVLSKPCVLAGACPGDLGDTEVLWRGRHLCVSKASGIVKLFGALEAALGYINFAAMSCKRQRRCLFRAYWSLFYLGLYLSTGNDFYYNKSLYMLRKSLRCVLPMLPDSPLGWVYCLDRCCAAVNNARAWVRWAERRLAAIEEGREAILVLNHLSSLLFEIMRTCKHGVKTSRGVVIVEPKSNPASFPAWW